MTIKDYGQEKGDWGKLDEEAAESHDAWTLRDENNNDSTDMRAVMSCPLEYGSCTHPKRRQTLRLRTDDEAFKPSSFWRVWA